MEFVSPVPQATFPKLQKEVENSILTALLKRSVFYFLQELVTNYIFLIQEHYVALMLPLVGKLGFKNTQNHLKNSVLRLTNFTKLFINFIGLCFLVIQNGFGMKISIHLSQISAHQGGKNCLKKAKNAENAHHLVKYLLWKVRKLYINQLNFDCFSYNLI